MSDKKIKTIIVEDEPLSRMFLENLLADFCPEVEVIGYATTEDDAVKLISSMKPGLVFLDIELQQGSGFGTLRRIDTNNTRIIFTTAYDHYAINAIILSGIDYLLKPFDSDGLQQAVHSVCHAKDFATARASMGHLLETLQNHNVPRHIALLTNEGAQFVPLADIIRLESTDTGTGFILSSGKVYQTVAHIKSWDHLLCNHSFFRTHQQHIVNVRAIGSMHQADAGVLIMKDNSKVPISPRKAEELRSLLLSVK